MNFYKNPSRAKTFKLLGSFLTEEQKIFFDEEGFIVFEPSEFGISFQDQALNSFNKYLPNWDKGYSKEFISKFKDPYMNDAQNVEGIIYRGTSHINRRRSGKLHKTNDNILSGRRAVLRGHKPNLDPNTYSLIENPHIMSLVSDALYSEKLCVSNFSLASVFPEHTGEDFAFHSDLSGFSKDPIAAFKRGDKHILAIMYLSDVDTSVAPLRIWPKSHKKYIEINRHISNILGYKKGSHAISNLTNYAELLPNWLEDPVDCVGPTGSIVLMNNTVIHCATSNYSKDKSRKTFFATYSPRSIPLEVKRYKAPNLFFRSISDSNLLNKTFYRPSKISNFFEKSIGKSKSFLKHFLKKYKMSSGSKKRDIESLKAMDFGSTHSHPQFITVDGSDKADKKVNFSLQKPLEFPNQKFNVIYSSHALEHLLEDTVKFYIYEFYRILKPNGFLRITLPDAKKFFESYDNLDLHFFDWVRNKGIYKQDSWLRMILRHFCDPILHEYSDRELYDLYYEMGYEKLLDKLCNEIDPLGDINSRVWGHQSWWNADKLSILLKKVGFKSIEVGEKGKSRYEILRNPKYFDNTKPEMSLFIECMK